jgi:hypothetical protein
MQFSPWSTFLPFRSKYPPQRSVLKNHQSMFLPQSERPSFAPIQHKWHNYSFVYFKDGRKQVVKMLIELAQDRVQVLVLRATNFRALIMRALISH